MFKWIAGGVAAFLSIGYLSRFSRASSNITSRVRIKIHKVDLAGMELKAEVLVQNPNPIRLSIQHPFVKVFYKDTLLGSSIIENTLIGIPEHGQKEFDLHIRSAGWLTLIQVMGTGVIGALRSGQQVDLPLKAQMITRANGLPYEKTEHIQVQF